MFFTFKQIRAKKLRQDALRLALLSMLHKIEREVKKDFEATTETWDHKPEFESIISLKDGASVLVGTDDEIYNWVDGGTVGHNIPLEISPNVMLKYRANFKAKTVPGLLKSRKGGKTGPFVKRKQVYNPGIKPRDFSGAVKKKWVKKFKRMAQDALNEFAKKSGHHVSK